MAEETSWLAMEGGIPSLSTPHILRVWLAQLSCWRRPRRFYELMSHVPLAGKLLQFLVQKALPRGTRFWGRVATGRGKGLWLFLDPRYEQDYARGDYELVVQNILMERLSPGGVFYDVGAHIGFFSLIAARRVGPTGSVLAVEADPENAKRISDHVSRNAFSQIEVISAAPWSQAGKLRFARSGPQSSRNTGSVVELGGPVGCKELIEQEAITLDSIFLNHRPPQIVKLDVEGAETEVLKGASKLFQEGRPVLLCEVHSGDAASCVTSWLKALGYSFEWLSGGRSFPRHLLASP